MINENLIEMYRNLEAKKGDGMALAIIGAQYGDDIAEELRQHLEDAGEFNPPTQLDQVKEVVELYFQEWGAGKAAKWTDLVGDKTFSAEAAMVYLQKILED